jgi:predicted Zn-dependent peptidase
MNSTTVHPSEQQFRILRKDLYGMGFSTSLSRYGEILSYSLISNCISPTFIKDSNYSFDACFEVVKEALFHVDFKQEKLDKEKKLLLNDWENIYNNKPQYALTQFQKAMFKNEAAYYSVDGEKENLEKVTLEDVKKAYEKLFTYHKVIYVSGNISKEEVLKTFSKFSFGTNYQSLDQSGFILHGMKNLEQVNVVEEPCDISQSIVVEGFRTPIRQYDKDNTSFVLFSQMMGGYFNSSLPQIVREKNSLAYSCYASHNPRIGVFWIYGAISEDNYEKYLAIVKKIIEEYQSGKIDQDVFDRTKKSLITSILQDEDSPVSTITDLIIYESGHTPKTTEELVKLYQEITIEDIVRVSKTIQLDTIYHLKGVKNGTQE